MTMSTFMFKWTMKDGTTDGGNSIYKYDLPTEYSAGKWHCKTKKKIVVCSSGFHCTGLDNILDFIAYGPELYLVEVDGKYDIYRTQNDPSEDSNKVAVEKIRLYYKFDIPEALRSEWNNKYHRCYMGSKEYIETKEQITKYILDNYQLPIGTVNTISRIAPKTGNLMKNCTFADTFAPGSF